MASTGKAALDDSVAAEIVEREMVQELRPALTSREFIRFASGGASTVASFPLWTDPGAATAPTDDLSEIASTALADTQVSATAAEVGFRVDVTDLVKPNSYMLNPDGTVSFDPDEMFKLPDFDNEEDEWR